MLEPKLKLLIAFWPLLLLFFIVLSGIMIEDLLSNKAKLLEIIKREALILVGVICVFIVISVFLYLIPVPPCPINFKFFLSISSISYILYVCYRITIIKKIILSTKSKWFEEKFNWLKKLKGGHMLILLIPCGIIIWMGYDAHHNKISITGKPYSVNTGVAAWVLSSLFLWIATIPYYFYKRAKTLKQRKEEGKAI